MKKGGARIVKAVRGSVKADQKFVKAVRSFVKGSIQ